MAGMMVKQNVGLAVAVVAVVFITVFAIVNIRDANGRAAEGISAQIDQLIESQACVNGLSNKLDQAVAAVQAKQTNWLRALNSGAGIADAEFELSAAERARDDALLAKASAARLCG